MGEESSTCLYSCCRSRDYDFYDGKTHIIYSVVISLTMIFAVSSFFARKVLREEIKVFMEARAREDRSVSRWEGQCTTLNGAEEQAKGNHKSENDTSGIAMTEVEHFQSPVSLSGGDLSNGICSSRTSDNSSSGSGGSVSRSGGGRVKRSYHERDMMRMIGLTGSGLDATQRFNLNVIMALGCWFLWGLGIGLINATIGSEPRRSYCTRCPTNPEIHLAHRVLIIFNTFGRAFQVGAYSFLNIMLGDLNARVIREWSSRDQRRRQRLRHRQHQRVGGEGLRGHTSWEEDRATACTAPQAAVTGELVNFEKKLENNITGVGSGVVTALQGVSKSLFGRLNVSAGGALTSKFVQFYMVLQSATYFSLFIAYLVGLFSAGERQRLAAESFSWVRLPSTSSIIFVFRFPSHFCSLSFVNLFENGPLNSSFSPSCRIYIFTPQLLVLPKVVAANSFNYNPRPCRPPHPPSPSDAEFVFTDPNYFC